LQKPLDPIVAGSERAVNGFILVWTRLIIRIDQRRLEVTVAHPFLQRPKWDACRSHARSEGMTQIVEAQVWMTYV
jgi:hypothetical protein